MLVGECICINSFLVSSPGNGHEKHRLATINRPPSQDCHFFIELAPKSFPTPRGGWGRVL